MWARIRLERSERGLARPVSNKEKRERNARMSKYPEVVGQLVSAVTKGCRNKPKFTLLQMEAMVTQKHSKQSFRI